MATVITAGDARSANATGDVRPLGPWANGMLMSPDEFDTATDWDEDYRYELINGVLIVSPPADITERDPNEELGFLLRTYRYQNPLGTCLDRTVSEETVATLNGRRRMDRALWIGLGRTPRPLKDIPAVAVEFVSDSARDRRRDLVHKRQEYAQIGVREYWVIDRFARRMTVFRGADTIVIGEAEIYRTDLLPGFELPLGRLLKAADDWTQDLARD
jgi:Uma2 family endonuclease